MMRSFFVLFPRDMLISSDPGRGTAMRFSLSHINKSRLLALLILAGSISLASYEMIKPQTFAYIKVRDDVTVTTGTQLKPEDIEKAELVTGNITTATDSPIPGLIPWEEAGRYIGRYVVRQVIGGGPLLQSDFALSDMGEQVLEKEMTGMSIPVNNIVGVTPHLSVGDKVHLYASYEDSSGAYSGLLLREMPVISLQRKMDGDVSDLVAVTIALQVHEAVLLTHALHYGKIHLGKASPLDNKGPGIGDSQFAAALLKTKKRWGVAEEE